MLGQATIFGTMQQKSGYRINDNRLFLLLILARPARFERATAWFVVSELNANILFLIVNIGTPVAYFA